MSSNLNDPLLKSDGASDKANKEQSHEPITPLGGRYRGFLPVVIDMETGGFNHHTDAL